MTDEQMFDSSCVQITLVGERDGATRVLTINYQTYDEWPKTIVVQGKRFILSETESEREFSGITPDDENEVYEERAFYDAE